MYPTDVRSYILNMWRWPKIPKTRNKDCSRCEMEGLEWTAFGSLIDSPIHGIHGLTDAVV